MSFMPFRWLHETAWATGIRESTLLFPLIESIRFVNVHIVNRERGPLERRPAEEAVSKGGADTPPSPLPVPPASACQKFPVRGVKALQQPNGAASTTRGAHMRDPSRHHEGADLAVAELALQ